MKAKTFGMAMGVRVVGAWTEENVEEGYMNSNDEFIKIKHDSIKDWLMDLLQSMAYTLTPRLTNSEIAMYIESPEPSVRRATKELVECGLLQYG